MYQGLAIDIGRCEFELAIGSRGLELYLLALTTWKSVYALTDQTGRTGIAHNTSNQSSRTIEASPIREVVSSLAKAALITIPTNKASLHYCTSLAQTSICIEIIPLQTVLADIAQLAIGTSLHVSGTKNATTIY